MSRATLKVLTPSDPNATATPIKIIFGNKTLKQTHPEVSLEGLGNDCFILKTVGDSRLVAGREPHGIMYAAFNLLERIGVRSWAVAPKGIFIPAK